MASRLTDLLAEVVMDMDMDMELGAYRTTGKVARLSITPSRF
jgi:hypothetical protein